MASSRLPRTGRAMLLRRERLVGLQRLGRSARLPADEYPDSGSRRRPVSRRDERGTGHRWGQGDDGGPAPVGCLPAVIISGGHESLT